MSSLIGPELYTFLLLSVGACIRLYPLRSALRLTIKGAALIYALFFIAQCAVFILFREYFTFSYAANQIFTVLCSVITMLIPIFITKAGIFQHVFLYLMVFSYTLIVFGAGNYVELAYGGAFAAQYPYLICDGVALVLSIPLLPLTLRNLDKLFKLLPGNRTLVWKFIWVLPAVFIAFCLISANIFNGNGILSAVFVVTRIIAGIGVVVTCLLLARSLGQEADNARHEENARMMEIQLELQRDQYTRLAKNAETEKAALHDARHHLAVMMDLNHTGKREKLGAYLAELAGAVPSQSEERYCANFAVNAVAAHYLGLAQSEDIVTDAKLVILENTGSIPAMDLCVIMGNLLENALEACRRAKDGDAYIRVRSRLDGEALSIIVENSFDGQWRELHGAYLSRKEGSDNAPREGVGLSSVRAVCEKHGGLMKIESTGSVWKASALVEMRV